MNTPLTSPFRVLWWRFFKHSLVLRHAWWWLSGLSSGWDPDGFNLSGATPSVTGGGGAQWCPGGAPTGGVSSGTLLVKHLKKRTEIYAEL